MCAEDAVILAEMLTGVRRDRRRAAGGFMERRFPA